uniref:Protein FAR1-RELATED SEQUENCE n=1 Tax=Lactuca sativa TaxID=4236 RepID=A0A9R1VWH3_LACSA|nr:hypothetical protein LSAT_V11C400208810 [Lactuca sativa]
MFDNHPKAIITDQDKSIGNAIRKVFPKNMALLLSMNRKIFDRMMLVIVIFKNSIENGSIVTRLKNLKAGGKLYVVTFVNDIFFAGMTTSGRSETIESRRAVEEDDDFKTMNSSAVLSSVHPIEAKAYEKVFENFKKEWMVATNNLTHETLKFETYGILCKHSLYVMKKRYVETLLSHYILPRWTINARYNVGNGSIRLEKMDNENGVNAFTLWYLRSNFTKLIEKARDSPLEIQKLNTLLISLLDDQNTSQGSFVGISQVDMMSQLSVRDPLGPTNTKGRPKNASRLKSFLEVPKKRTYSYCQGLSHFATSCSKRKVVTILLSTDESLQEK